MCWHRIETFFCYSFVKVSLTWLEKGLEKRKNKIGCGSPIVLIWASTFYSLPGALTTGPTQAFGFWAPTSLGVTFVHSKVGGPSGPVYSMLMSPISTFSHGCPLLHNSFTASLFPDVPLICLKLMLASLIVDGFCLLHWFQGQYSWSMRIGFITFLTMISPKWISKVVVEHFKPPCLVLSPL